VSLYIDTSALLKRYIDEEDSDACEQILIGDPVWVSARHTWVEVIRNLAKLLAGTERVRMKKTFGADWDRFHVVEIDKGTCRRAGELAESLQVRTLDALHLAAAERAGGSSLTFLTYDTRQAHAARSLGWTVLGR
jgi:predicted nucleic acid-binding protein